jgi:hypothetical protein
MIPTLEQFEAMHDGARQEHNRRATALTNALTALKAACKDCWFNQSASNGGCEQAHCSIWRMMNEYTKMRRMQHKEQLDSWDWYAEAKNTGRMLFVTTDAKLNQNA